MLDEVRALLSMMDSGDYTCAGVKVVGEKHLEAVQTKLADIRRLEKALIDLVSHCSGEPTPACPMLETLFNHRRAASMRYVQLLRGARGAPCCRRQLFEANIDA